MKKRLYPFDHSKLTTPLPSMREFLISEYFEKPERVRAAKELD